MQNTSQFDLQNNYLRLREIVEYVNSVVEKIKNNVYDYLNDKHNYKLDPSIDSISQDTYNRQQQQILFDIFKRTVYYFDNIQYDLHDQFWQKAKNLLKIDFSKLSVEEQGQIYKNLLHAILQYEIRVKQQQQKLYEQKKQAQRIKKILKQKQLRQKQLEQQKKQQEKQRRKKQQQLIDAYDKMYKIVSESFEKHFRQLNKAKTSTAYAVSKQRRLQKQYKSFQNKKPMSSKAHVTTPKKPRRPKTGKSY